ncbi:hypothetical protein Taro_021476 [Colocasia esculenta]|uniref:Uncharacterized protein n=1 Tax=Colocasia esculenta TaxID=4460 RepID=A0A843UZ63_COLES|nr:hypothetical protein [Colocasia esculenta]
MQASLEHWRSGERLGKTWSSSTSLCINPEICREFLAFKGKPRMNYTLTRSGTTRSDVMSTLLS